MSKNNTYYKENETNLKKIREMEGTISERAVRQGFFKKRL